MQSLETEPSHIYFEYLKQKQVCLDPETEAKIQRIIAATNWDEPTTGLDFNNCAVITLIEAENSTDISLRDTYLGLAGEYLEISAAEYPLGLAHQLMVQFVFKQVDWQHLLQTFYNLLQDAYTQICSPGLVYVPTFFAKHDRDIPDIYNSVIRNQNGYLQSLIILLTSLQIYVVFYNQLGELFTQLNRLVNDQPRLLYRMGMAFAIKAQPESIAYLHAVQAITHENPQILQSLYLAYRNVGEQQRAEYWWQFARESSQNCRDFDWAWTQVSSSESFTYLKFDQDIQLAVEPSLRSIVTSVLLVEGDWFENDLDWWRAWLKPGMTVIDVGANAGVYSFSAAKRVEASGKVIAIEPFSPCIKLLELTKEINHFDQVKIFEAAASNHPGLAYLSVQASSELNELITVDPGQAIPPNTVTINCLTLDSLIETEQLTSVNILKIDAEGHELQVLQGAETIITTFQPMILYENISGGKLASTDVNEFLIQHGYKLFTYNPLLRQLLPLDTANKVQPLNIIAQSRVQ